MHAVLCAQTPSPDAGRNPRFTGTPFLRAWTPADYAGNPVCQAIAQHPVTGFIYVATNGGLLEFDGARWRSLETPGGPMPALAFDGRGRTWFMGEGRIGYVADDEQGQTCVVSAKSRLPADERELAAVVGALAADGGIYCGTLRALHFLDDRDTSPARTLLLPGLLRSMWATGGAPHITLQDGASFRVREGKLEPVGTKAPEILARAGELFLTARGPVPATTEDIFEGDFANAAIVLADGRCAFGTERSGLVICDSTGRVLQRITRAHGLPKSDGDAYYTDGLVGIGTTVPRTRLHIKGSIAGGDAPENHVAYIENVRDGHNTNGLAIRLNNTAPSHGTVYGLNDTNNFIARSSPPTARSPRIYSACSDSTTRSKPTRSSPASPSPSVRRCSRST